MQEYRQHLLKHGNWVFITPVSGVRLTDAVDNEFRIKRILLIDRKKLPRVRRRLSIPQRVSNLDPRYQEFLNSSETFAVLRHSGKPDELRTKCLRMVKDELSILALSQLGYSRRRFGHHPVIKGEAGGAGIIDRLFLSSDDNRSLLQSNLAGSIDDLWLNGVWSSFHKKTFFYKLLKTINGTINVARAWRNDLEKAAILVGQSQCSNDIAQGFLWNMIVLELLLTEQGDKYTDVLPKRIEGFLGWVGFWEVHNYEDRIREMYRKRCAFVHSGKREDITVKDLLFTDDLLFNLLLNLIHHIDRFPSKEDVIEFSKMIEAEHLLGVRPKVRPKTLMFISRNYSEQDYAEI